MESMLYYPYAILKFNICMECLISLALEVWSP